MTAARQIYDHFRQGGWSYVQELVESRRSESLHLDFKAKQNSDSAQFDRDDRRNFAEALSGFANAEGGVIAWGIDARRTGDTDSAVGLKPLENLTGVLSSLTQLTPEMVSPAVQGVEHLAVPLSARSNAGVIVTYVPQSDSTPHMARGPKMHTYYRRVSDTFRPLEHYEVADLFGRRAHPAIRVRPEWDIHISSTSGDRATARVTIRFILENQGRGLARYPALTLGSMQGYTASQWSGQHGGRLPLASVPAPKARWLRFAGGADVVVYPDDEFEVALVAADISSRQRDFPDLRISYTAVAADSAPEGGEFLIPGVDVQERAWQLFSARGFDPRER